MVVASYLYLYAKLPDECVHASDDIVHNAGRLKHAHVEKTIDPKVRQVLAKEHTVGIVYGIHIFTCIPHCNNHVMSTRISVFALQAPLY